MSRAISKRHRNGYHRHCGNRTRLFSMRLHLQGHPPSRWCSPLLLVGLLVGFVVTMCIQSLNCLPPSLLPVCPHPPTTFVRPHRQLRSVVVEPFIHSPSSPSSSPLLSPHSSSYRQLLLVGVMTAQKYVDSRAYNLWKTWAQHISGQVLFFVSEHTVSAHSDLPLVRLAGVDDTYPPQKKSFAMLRWMADHGLHRFRWFMRADDDLYVRGDRLDTFLRSLDSDRPLFLGQAGLGTVNEYGRLALEDNENYCMGGPGIILSSKTLAVVRPHLAECLRNMHTTHEDVEIGRCIHKHVGVLCTWNYEMQTILYNNQSGQTAFTGDLNVEEVHQGMTLHPVKLPPVMRRLHTFIRGQKVADLRYRSVQLSRDARLAMVHLRRLDNPLDIGQWNRVNEIGKSASLFKFIPRTHDQVQRWDQISATNVLFCSRLLNCPRHNAESYLKSAIGIAVRQMFELFNRNARQRGRLLQFQTAQYSYNRIDPVHGVDYVLDVVLWFKKFRGSRRTNISVRRHAYVQQPFGFLQIIDDDRWRQMDRQRIQSRQMYANSIEQDAPVVFIEKHGSIQPIIHILVPLSGRISTFRRFADHFRSLCSDTTDGGIALIVVLFNSETVEENIAIQSVLSELTTCCPSVTSVKMHNRPFSRGVALARGAESVPSNGLMFFTDVDMVFTKDALRRIRLNTILNLQIYFPIVFSEYSPTTWTSTEQRQPVFQYERTRGYFRHFGFGLVSLYRADLDRVGGLNTHIDGWGLEDVDLFEKCLKHTDLTVFRAPDPGLVHIYHPVNCPPSMSSVQHRMCMGSKANSYSSVDFLADTLIPAH